MDQTSLETTSLEGEVVENRNTITLEEADAGIRNGLKDAAQSVITVGYYLKAVRDNELFRSAGYETIWDYAWGEYGFSKGTASRYMKRNDRFSIGGNSPIIADEFRAFNRSQLQEMLSLDAEQMSTVTPDMTVREIRELRRPKEIPYFEIPGQLSLSDFPELDEAETEDSAVENSAPTETVTSTTAFTVSAEDLIGEPEEKLSAYGFPKRVYPADSLLTTPGCRGDNGRGYDCFNCHLECEIRQEYCQCVDATCGFPFPCQMVDTGKREILEKKIGERCQFIDLNLADHKAGDGSPVPCCKDCETPCEYACERSGKRVATSQQSVAADAQQETAGNAAEKQQDIPEKPKTEKCIHDGISRCTLSEEDKEKDGTGKDCAHHCCWNCVKRDGCNIECYASSKRKTLDDDEVAAEDEENAEQPAEPIEFDRKTLEDMIRNAQGALDQMCDYWVENQPYTYARYNMMIQAYKLLLKEHDESDQKLDPVEQQPELRLLKNDKQRAEFIDAYEEWPLWIDNQETGEKYYRYELPDGTSFVVKTYHSMLYDYKAGTGMRYKEGYGRNEQYILESGKFFRDCSANRSAMIEKLKELQKSEQGGKKDADRIKTENRR